MSKHEQLIEGLSVGLAPVNPVSGTRKRALSWFGMSVVFVVAITNIVGPARSGVMSQLASETRFLAETLLGLFSIAWVGLAAFRSAIPARLTRKFATAGLVLMAVWLAQYVLGLVSPALEPSTLGKRPYCYLETMIYSVPPILAGLFLVRRLFPLRFHRTVMMLSLAAGMIPALYMQLACMYDASHILRLHILPGLLMVGAGLAIAAIWQKFPQSSD